MVLLTRGSCCLGSVTHLPACLLKKAGRNPPRLDQTVRGRRAGPGRCSTGPGRSPVPPSRSRPPGRGRPPPPPRRAPAGGAALPAALARSPEMLPNAAAAFSADVILAFGTNGSLSAAQLSALLGRQTAPPPSQLLPQPQHNQVAPRAGSRGERRRGQGPRCPRAKVAASGSGLACSPCRSFPPRGARAHLRGKRRLGAEAWPLRAWRGFHSSRLSSKPSAECPFVNSFSKSCLKCLFCCLNLTRIPLIFLMKLFCSV